MGTRLICAGAILTLVLLLSMPVAGQETDEVSLLKGTPVFTTSPRFHMGVQGAFASNFSGQTAFTQSLAPALNWDVSKRFSLEVGTILSSTRLNGPNPLFPYTPHMSGGEAFSGLPATSLLSTQVYAVGAYQVNPRLTLVGAGWMEQHQPAGAAMNPAATALNPRGMHLGFDYQVNERFSLGAGFLMSEGMNPFDPWQRSAPLLFYSPSPFHRGTRW